jgi:hypothetical protein
MKKPDYARPSQNSGLPPAEIERRQQIEASTDDAMMAKLPPPPKPFHEQDEDDIFMWLIAVAEAGGHEGLRWCYQPRNWPYGPSMRLRMQHIHSDLLRRVEEQRKNKLEAEAWERREQQRLQERDSRKQRGWA